MLRIAIRSHGQAERLFETDEKQVTIGRAGHNGLVIENPHISSQHARIDLLVEGATLIDVGSTNGSMIERGDLKIAVEAGGHAVALDVGDRIILGDSEAPVTLVLMEDGRGDGDPEMLAPPPTAISEVPVDPSARGDVCARLPAQKFAELGDDLVSRPAYARALHGLLPLLVEPELEILTAAVADAMFAFSSVATHFFFGVNDPKSGAPSTGYRFNRSGEADTQQWQPRRVVLARAAIAREARHLSGCAVEGLDDATTREALCVPIFVGDRVWGHLFVDNRGSERSFDVTDLKMLASLSYLLSTALPIDVPNLPGDPENGSKH